MQTKYNVKRMKRAVYDYRKGIMEIIMRIIGKDVYAK